MNDYPKTKDEWWEFVDGKWDGLKALVLSYEVHSLPAFGTLCNLCSESSVLFEEE